ncbi:phosphonate C-P lyase system protein PhnG [Rhizobium sp. TRM95111]|uniref:phosphonate C-P lyase system protein PhnG n=1 Tax=Rhizobium alarense TaxID=2846851 RepID=UPI001F31267A|nr:phosphonate C-P lyase system protein PhnG [Rhizobium alarense]MCF3640849.1 phosphonate C-P lyase system protein PhnG [Rhizobium alarense]
MPDISSRSAGNGDRSRAMGLLARATIGELRATWQVIEPKPDVAPVRGPETGLVMVRGRIGGGGSPFNLGETTVTRASVRLQDGTIGHGQVLGTDIERARLAAIFDALMQDAVHAGHAARLVEHVARRIAEEDARSARETAATRVDFFTMVRGED